VAIDSGEERPGAKFYHWEMKGVPVRLEIGPRDLKEKKITLVRRDSGEKSQIEFREIEKIEKTFDDIRLFKAKSLKDIENYAGKGIISVGWCNKKECAEKIEEHTNILCTDKNPMKCIICNNPGREVRIAKTY